MSRLTEFQLFISLKTLLATVVLAFAAIAIGPMISILHVGIREIIILALIVLMSSLVFIPSERVLRLGFTLWILTFAFGWRTIYLTPSLNIHPSEVVAFLLFFATIARSILDRSHLDFSLPHAIPFFMLFAIFGIYIAFQNARPIDVVFQEFKIFLSLILAYYIVRWSIQTREDWEGASRWAIAVAVYIGCLGLIDYFFPETSRALSGRTDSEIVYLTKSYGGSEFARAGFVFFGHSAASFVIFTFLGFTLYHLLNQLGQNRQVRKQVFLVAILFVQVAGIYFSGFRGLWYAAGVFLIVYAFFQRRAWGLLVAGILVLPLLPIDFIYRFQSVFNPEYADSSQYDRIFRANYALDLFRQSPWMGIGWGGSGYVHSDLIQIAANLGVFGFFFFSIWIVGVLWQLFRLTRHPSWVSGYAGILFAMTCAVIVIFAGEGLIAFIQLMIPIWFLFAMCGRLAELASKYDVSSLDSPNDPVV